MLPATEMPTSTEDVCALEASASGPLAVQVKQGSLQLRGHCKVAIDLECSLKMCTHLNELAITFLINHVVDGSCRFIRIALRDGGTVQQGDCVGIPCSLL